MTVRQTVVVAALVIVAMALTVLLSVLSARKAVLAAEGADLVSTQRVLVDASLTELEARSSQFARGTRVFTDAGPATRAVALISGDWADVPLHHGRSLSGEDGEALVGARRAPGTDELVVGARRYDVVGRLGTRPESLLADEAVVADRSLFGVSRGPLWLDGPDAEGRFRAAFPDRQAELIDRGTNRRTNVDVVTPFLLLAGAGAVSVITLAAGVLGAQLEGRRARLRFLVGQRVVRLIAASVVRTALLATACACVALGAAAALGSAFLVQVGAAAPVGAVAATVVLTAVVGLVGGSRRWNC